MKIKKKFISLMKTSSESFLMFWSFMLWINFHHFFLCPKCLTRYSPKIKRLFLKSDLGSLFRDAEPCFCLYNSVCNLYLLYHAVDNCCFCGFPNIVIYYLYKVVLLFSGSRWQFFFHYWMFYHFLLIHNKFS